MLDELHSKMLDYLNSQVTSGQTRLNRRVRL